MTFLTKYEIISVTFEEMTKLVEVRCLSVTQFDDGDNTLCERKLRRNVGPSRDLIVGTQQNMLCTVTLVESYRFVE